MFGSQLLAPLKVHVKPFLLAPMLASWFVGIEDKYHMGFDGAKNACFMPAQNPIGDKWSRDITSVCSKAAESKGLCLAERQAPDTGQSHLAAKIVS